MLDKKQEPKLRFREFKGNWSVKNLGQLGVFLKGQGISKEEIIPQGKNRCIRYGELYTNYSEVITQVKSRTNSERNTSVLSKENDVLIPSSGETAIDIATVSCVKDKDILIGGDLNILRLDNQVGVFFAYYLKNYKRRSIARLAQGHSVVHLYASHLKDLKVSVPLTIEQEKIASFLSSVDSYIENLKQQKESLEKYKKGMMQKIFSQEIRFKDENGKEFSVWEQKKLSEISYITTGSSNREDSAEIGDYTFFDRSVDIRKSNKYLFDTEAIIVAGEGQDFIPKYFSGKFDLHQRAYAIMNFTGVNALFIYYYLNFHRNYLKKMSVGTTMPSLRLPIFNNMKIKLPRIKEQNKIADYFSKLDVLTQTKNKQIEKTEQWKKGLLQQLFI